MDEHNQCVESQESKVGSNADDTGALQDEANSCSAEEQRNVIAAELQRVAEAAQSFLPEICFDMTPAKKESPESAQECTTRTTTDEFIDLSNDNFDLIDTDEDGFMSENEIDAAVQNSKFSGRDARFVAALKEHQEELEELNDDETGDENDGISRSDIAQFDALQKQMGEERNDFAHARDYAKKNFSALDADSDGHVTEDELDATLEAGGLDADQIHKIQTLKKLSGDLEEGHDDEIGDENDGFTDKDLDDYWSQEYASQDHVQLVRGVQGTMDKTQRHAEKATSSDLYANPMIRCAT